ncbi:MAG TPA: hypothetical protein VGM56_19915, partial [Byssovorax sp.]
LVAVPAAAYAQTDAQVAAARAAFKEGDEAEKRRDLPTALAKFKAALAVKETPQLILRIGGVQEKLGQLGQAMLSYERGLERAQAANLAPVVKVVKEQIDALRPRVPTVVVTVAKQYPDLAVTLDDKPLALGTKLYLDPGDHKLVARASGYDTKEKPFAATERDALEFQLDLAPTGGAAPPVGGPPAGETAGPSSDKPSRLPSVILISGGGAAIATGIVFFVLAGGKDSDVDKLCGGSDRLHCPPAQETTINSDVSSVKTFQVVGGVAVGVGAVAVGIGTYMLLRTPKPAPAAAFEVLPSFGPSQAGLTARGAF